MDILKVNNISKSYRAVRALDGVSFSVPEGSVYGLLGPNGSGKTTLLGIVTGVLNADNGGYTLFDDTTTPPHRLRRQIGTLLETPNFYGYLSALDNLEITCEIKGADKGRIGDILRQVGLYERRHSKFATFSLGMKQRLGIGAALLGDPRLLILDEPTNGLDPEGIAEIRDLIRSLGASGHTIVMASHLLDEVEKVCTHVAVLKSGRLLGAGPVDGITAGGATLELAASDTGRLVAFLLDTFPGRRIEEQGETVLLYLPEDEGDAAAINDLCHNAGISLSRLVLKKQSLESMFLELVSNPSNNR